MDIPFEKIRQLENVRSEIQDKDIADLMRSIKQHGLLQPIGLWHENDEYIIAFGNRRFEAMKKLGWNKLEDGEYKILPQLTRQEFLFLNTTENVQRKEIQPIELGKIVRELRGNGLSYSEIAAVLSLPEHRIRQSFDLYSRMPEKMRNTIGFMYGQKKISSIAATTAGKIMKSRLSKDSVEKLMDYTRKENLGGSEVEILLQLMKEGKPLNEAKEKLSSTRICVWNFTVNKDRFEQLRSHYSSNANLFRAIFNGKESGKGLLV